MKLICTVTYLLGLLAGAVLDPLIEGLFASECTNCDKLPAKVGFTDPDAYPFTDYPFSGFDSVFNTDVSCIIKVDKRASQAKGHLVYSLMERDTTAHLEGQNKYETHTHACGVCSDLKSLASYLEFPQMENQISECGVNALPLILVTNGLPVTPAEAFISSVYQLNGLHNAGRPIVLPPEALAAMRQCISARVKLEGMCINAWAWDVIHVALECGGVCLSTVYAGISANVLQAHDFLGPGGVNYCIPNICSVTVNGEPACYPETYEDALPYRINYCLQCEECKNNPIMMKWLGCLRHNSGLVSGIARPDDIISEITHDYGLVV